MHLTYLILSHLGSSYVYVVAARTRLTLLLVLVKQKLRGHVSNLKTVSILLRETEAPAKGKQQSGGLMEQYKVPLSHECFFPLLRFTENGFF
jgi:hypothetical protein